MAQTSIRRLVAAAALALGSTLVALPAGANDGPAVRHVLLLSVDGIASDGRAAGRFGRAGGEHGRRRGRPGRDDADRTDDPAAARPGPAVPEVRPDRGHQGASPGLIPLPAVRYDRARWNA